jgi:hypothetical protein
MSESAVRRRLSREVPGPYLPLIARMRFYIEPQISCSRFFGEACFTEASIAAYRAAPDPALLELSEMGADIAGCLKGGLFADIPCGLHALREDADFDLAPLVRALGAAEMWETDLDADVVRDRVPDVIDVVTPSGYALQNVAGPIGLRLQNGLDIATLQDDVLGFVAKYADPSPRPPTAFYLSALQPDATFCADTGNQREVAVPYLTALYAELDRACMPGDLVILNSADMLAAGIDETLFPAIHPAVALPMRGFTLRRRCPRNKVQVYRKD